MTSQPRRVLVTGATGFVGSFLVERLLREQCSVICVARGRDGADSRQRVLSALAEVGWEGCADRLHVVHGDVTSRNAGVGQEDLRTLAGGVDELWHCAASTSFASHLQDEVRLANVEGTRRVLEVAKRLEVKSFLFASTLFVHGPHSDPALEEPVGHSRFRNTYEDSKAQCERLVLDAGIPHVLFRLPVIVGRTHDGLARQYLGFYSLARVFYRLRARVLRDAQNPDVLAELIRVGVRIENELRGTAAAGPLLHLPIHIRCEPDATVNLLPIDIVIETMIAVAASATIGKHIVQIANGTPPSVRDLFDGTLSLIGIVDQQLGPGRARQHGVGRNPLDRYNRRIEQQTAAYSPYIHGEPRFSRDSLQNLIGRAALPDFDFSPDYLRRMVGSAIEAEWGSRE